MTTEKQIKQYAPSFRYHLPHIPEYESLDDALADVTDLVIISHPDDDVLAGAHAISESHTNVAGERKVGVVVMSNSPGTGKPPGLEHLDPEKIAEERWREQTRSAETGRYAVTMSCGFSSKDIKGLEDGDNLNPEGAGQVRATIHEILKHAPKVKTLYTHSNFDAHETHQALSKLTLQATRMLGY